MLRKKVYLTLLNDKAIILFLIYTGARINEALGLKVRDISFQSKINTATLLGKGAKPRKIALHPVLYSTLRQMIEIRDKEPEDYLFTSIRKGEEGPIHSNSVLRKIKFYLKRAELDSGRSCHSFRRTVISSLLEKRKRIEHIAEIVGHSNINTTKRYNTREMKRSEDPLLSLDFN